MTGHKPPKTDCLTACRSRGLSTQQPSRLLKNYSQSTAAYGTKNHARSGRAAEPDIQLLIAGSAGAERSSVARDPGHGGRGADPDVGTVRRHVCQRGPAVDCAGKAVAGAVAADAVLGAQRASADGRDGLQPAVPLVCGA